jgi:hypothetical protein
VTPIKLLSLELAEIRVICSKSERATEEGISGRDMGKRSATKLQLANEVSDGVDMFPTIDPGRVFYHLGGRGFAAAARSGVDRTGSSGTAINKHVRCRKTARPK